MNYLLLVVTTLISTCPAEVIKLWEGEVPFAKKEKAEQVITEKRPGEFRVTEVTDPDLKTGKRSSSAQEEVIFISHIYCAVVRWLLIFVKRGSLVLCSIIKFPKIEKELFLMPCRLSMSSEVARKNGNSILPKLAWSDSRQVGI